MEGKGGAKATKTTCGREGGVEGEGRGAQPAPTAGSPYLRWKLDQEELEEDGAL